MASVDAINSQVSFTGSHKKGKSEKPSLVKRINEAYINTINEKYDVDYDSLDLKSKRILDKDYFTEKALCAGLSLISIALLIKKGRTMLNGVASAAGNSVKNLAHKPVDNMISGGNKGLGAWVGNKLTTIINAPATKKTNNVINSNISQIIGKQNDIIKKGSDAVSDTLDALNKLLSDNKYDKKEIDLKNIQALLKTMGKKGGNGSATEILSLKYLDQIEKLDTSKVDAVAFTEKLITDLTENLNNGKKSFSVTSKTMNRMADNIEHAGNQDLANAIRGLIPEKIEDGEVFSVLNSDFNTIVANNKMTVFDSVKPGKIDKESGFHKFLSKIFRKEDTLKTVEGALEKQGITDFGKLAETGAAAAIAATGSNGVYDTIDDFTNGNDRDMAKLTEEGKNIAEIRNHVINGGKISTEQLKNIAKIAAEVAPSFFDAA